MNLGLIAKYYSIIITTFIIAIHSNTFTLCTKFLSLKIKKTNQMKIQCDVCNKEEASVFCSADEAALCNGCDHRVHYANKLASKHQRFSLVNPNPNQIPLCDICQGKRAFLFCQQDRAILCRDCDVSIHKSNEHTKKHTRFLLSGIKLGTVTDLYVPKVDVVSKSTDSDSSVPGDSSSIHHHPVSTMGSISTISEYLIDTLPGWQVEDLLGPTVTPFGFSKSDEGILSFTDETAFESTWSDQAPFITEQSQFGSYLVEQQAGLFKESKAPNTNMKFGNSKSWSDDGFTVPQISSQSTTTTSSKRSRYLW